MTAPGRASRGVRIAGTGSYLPEQRLTNADLVAMMDTTDEWIVQRTGIRERRRARIDQGESVSVLAAHALRQALDAAHLRPDDLDLIIGATMTPEMECPTCACLVAEAVGASRAGAFDLNAACSGFVFGLNVAHDLIRGGAYNTIALLGADTLTRHMNYSTAGRGTAIIFGDGAGAAILRATDDPALGILAQSIHASGPGWKDIYIPHRPTDFPSGTPPDANACGYVSMNGSSVFKFAVGTFPKLIEETLHKANLGPADIDLYICHQSNARILTAAREKFGLPESKLHINIDRVGNTVGASVPICLDELVRDGRVHPGMKVMFLAFGGGLTWGSSLWQL
ncbi:MAG: 3-oxoacyl-[acyl-carrier-protein] synthase 3 [Phycisphaerae bacterium]|nr:MAG: 3-oxoacyl-[acyl-carrier-protein] synthase 3 [Phycisphaerae bacterium]